MLTTCVVLQGRNCKIFYLLLLLISQLGLTGGCAPAYLSHPDLGNRVAEIRKLVILPPRISVYAVGGGGVPQRMDEWSDLGARNVATALAVELGRRPGLEVTTFESAQLANDVKMELEQTQLLFDSVSTSLELFVYGPPQQRLNHKRANFDYSLGTEIKRLNAASSDAYLIIKGQDRIFDALGRALQVTTFLAAAPVGILMAADSTTMNMALVDGRTGDILWYQSNRSAGPYDLREPASAAEFVRSALSDFPLR